MSASFAMYLGFSLADQRRLTAAGLLHDVGKLRIDGGLLNKPGSLTDEEALQMRHHSDEGHTMLVAEGVQDDVVLEIVRKHHERLDGSGYPNGILANAIP